LKKANYAAVATHFHRRGIKTDAQAKTVTDVLIREKAGISK
jgi:tRNA G26 N,N-dimethylase Trm1